ncbi:MAG: diaminopimelate epimerase [Actinobacteria bacterium]|nr:diaminopimelate epimerase [Actinomycetota bacterium]
MTVLRLTKHHGLENDFLVLLDPGRETTVTAELARALCDRRTGIGADGLLHASKGDDGADLDLTVWNADGSVAETSGNGLRCLAQAAVDAGITTADLLVRTGGQIRSLSVEAESRPGLRNVSVSMGVPHVKEADPGAFRAFQPAGASRAASVDTGNPHLVVVVADLDVLQAAFMERQSVEVVGEPVNLEAIRLDGGRVHMRVWERGVGETRACGSGAVAVAAATRSWGMSGNEVEVVMPGGAVTVTHGADGSAVLRGPAKFIGRVQVDSDRITA